jgi:thiamine biosynthesis lipoprotein ApbE
MTLTIIAPSAIEAEIAAKQAFILGSDEGLRWIDTQDNFAAFAVLQDGAQKSSARWAAQLWQEAQTV